MQHQPETDFEKYLETLLEHFSDKHQKKAFTDINKFLDLVAEILTDRFKK